MDNEHFRILGHDRGCYYFMSSGSGQIVGLRSSEMAEGNLVVLAPLQWWESEYPSKGGPHWKMARNSLVQMSHAHGIYDPSIIRGRGAWWDVDRAVLHLGDRLIIDGTESPLSAGQYIYEAAAPFPINHDNPLSASEANLLTQICEMLSWEKKINAKYLAGWCAIAPVCGALAWRPHIWLTGSAGSGKSTVLDKIVRRIIGSIGFAVQSATTEAGLRQSLNHDARPILFDELDSSGQRAELRIQSVLELARQASTEGGAKIVKGTANGEPISASIRSCFAFSSINVSVKSRPDASRITVLGLEADGNQERYERLCNLISSTLTEDYVNRFLARSIRMIPVIRENARIFSGAAASELGSQRAGDQIGGLLAGAYSLHSDNPVTTAQAEAYIAKQDWSEQKGLNEDTDEAKCLSLLLQHMLRVPSKMGHVDRSIADLRDTARDIGNLLHPVDVQVAHEYLNRYGIRIDPEGVVISATHNEIAKILRDTEWSINWARTLRRLPGAKMTDGSIRFGSIRSRGVVIPYEHEPSDEAVLEALARR